MKTYLLNAFSKIRYLALLMFLTLVSTHAWGADVTLDFTTQGYTNSKNMNDVSLTVSGVTAKFAKGSSGTNPTYYTSGTHVRCYYKNTITITSSSTITKIVFTFASGENSNTITPSSGTLTSGTWTGSATSVTFTIGGTSGHRRIQKLVVTTGGSYSVVWTINPAAGGTLSSTSGTSTTVTPNAAYTYGSPAYTVTTGSATVSKSTNTFTATPTANCTIRINMVEKPKYTVTLKDDDTELAQVTAGASVTLPSRDGCAGYTFAGWTKSWATAQTTWTTTAPTIIPAGSYTPTANENLYPVYTKTESGGSVTWTQVTSVAVGDEVVIAQVDDGTKEMIGFNTTVTTANNYGTSESFTTNPAGTMIWTVEAGSGSNQFSFKNGNYYLNLASNYNYLNGSETKNANSSWTVSTSSSRAVVTNASQNTRKIMWNKSSPRFASYAKNHGNNSGSYYYHIVFYKKSNSSTTYYISVPNCCTPLGAINGSISLTNESNC